MTSKLGFTATILASGLLGAFGACFLFVLWTWLFQPQLFGDGQYVLAFLVISPWGWLAGSVPGASIALLSQHIVKPSHPYLVSIGLVVGGVIVVPFVCLIVMAWLFALAGRLINR